MRAPRRNGAPEAPPGVQAVPIVRPESRARMEGHPASGVPSPGQRLSQAGGGTVFPPPPSAAASPSAFAGPQFGGPPVQGSALPPGVSVGGPPGAGAQAPQAPYMVTQAPAPAAAAPQPQFGYTAAPAPAAGPGPAPSFAAIAQQPWEQQQQAAVQQQQQQQAWEQQQQRQAWDQEQRRLAWDQEQRKLAWDREQAAKLKQQQGGVSPWSEDSFGMQAAQITGTAIATTLLTALALQSTGMDARAKSTLTGVGSAALGFAVGTNHPNISKGLIAAGVVNLLQAIFSTV